MPSCPSGKVIAMRDSFLGSTVALQEAVTEVGAGFNPAESIAGVCCSGVDLIVQTLSHGEWTFLMAMGTVLQKVRCRTKIRVGVLRYIPSSLITNTFFFLLLGFRV
jgi:hypothetical protein